MTHRIIRFEAAVGRVVQLGDGTSDAPFVQYDYGEPFDVLQWSGKDYDGAGDGQLIEWLQNIEDARHDHGEGPHYYVAPEPPAEVVTKYRAGDTLGPIPYEEE